MISESFLLSIKVSKRFETLSRKVLFKKNIQYIAVLLLCNRGSGYVGVQSHNAQILLEDRGQSAMIALRDVGKDKLAFQATRAFHIY